MYHIKMTVSSSLALLSILISVAPALVRANGCAAGGPDGQPLCCDGKEISCVTQGYRVGSRYYQPCYCDSACTYTRDCCSDYQQTCQAVDCEVSAWSYWSGCSVRCGVGISERRRVVVTEPKNAGEKCPPLRQIKACYSSYCDISKKYGNGVALILPHYLGDRREDAEFNIVKNFHYRDRVTFNSYCVYFKLRRVNKHCYTDSNFQWTDSLTKSKTVCVECNRPAYGTDGKCHGEGVRKEKSRFAAVDVPGCRGRWIQQSIEENCKCNTGADYIFI
ncbi:somatomedin-B and thrombospondin type-1 domain-containing protein-like [Diadema setosum]|uniref:somatomedin-B and thrombospondin type-1 domain-containing protein-like n=1 Tax=Diadema setosum TaxID=31175 RepID=UPI003B3AA8A8